MKNLLKKFAVLMASVMLMMTTFAMPSYADTPTSFKVGGLTNGVKATAYKIVNQNERGETSLVLPYTAATGSTTASIDDVEHPTGAEIMALVQRTDELAAATTGQKIGPVNASGATNDSPKSAIAEFTGASAGMYLVVFENQATATTLYNPVIVSINYDDNAVKQYNINKQKYGSDVEGIADAWAKSSDIPFKKVVDRDANKNGNSNSNVDNPKTNGDEASFNNTNTYAENGDTAGTKLNGDAKVGDVVSFRINTALPAYADNYFTPKAAKDPEFVIYDTLSKGLTLLPGNNNANIKVYVGNPLTQMDASNYTITPNVTANGEDTFNISFSKAALQQYGGQDIEVRYSAQVNGLHGCNFDGETNTGRIEYTRNPGEDKKAGPSETTYHYTFTVNGKVDGNAQEDNREVVKVGVDASGNQVFKETTWTTEKGWKPLQGVTFKLYKKKDGANTAQDYANEKAIKTAISDERGMLIGIDQIDAGEYVLIETDLGSNTEYAINNTPINLSIEAWLDSLGRLEKYQVKVNDISVGHYKKDYNGDTTNGQVQFLNDAGDVLNTHHQVEYNDGTTTRTFVDTDGEAADIRNSKVGTLPSTGGMGTILFTIGGIVLIGLAFLLLFGGRRRQHQK